MRRINSKHLLNPIECYQNREYIYSLFPIEENIVDLESLLLESCLWKDKEIREVAAQMLSAIASLHSEGYYHSNLQPKYFLINKLGYVKLTNMFYAKKIEPANARRKDRIVINI